MGQTTVITGGAQGLGLAMANKFGDQGYNIVVADLDEKSGQNVANQLQGRGIEAIFIKTDVSDKTSMENLINKSVEHFGRLDVMINNAGISLIGPSESVSEDDWDKSINVMQKGVFFGCQEAGKVMMKQKAGVIINISSINATVMFPMRLAYCAAKAAVSAMTKVLALEWAEHHIRVNAVAPGVSNTNMVKQAIEDKYIDTERYYERIPMKRFGEPDEIADACLFLSSKQASYITGVVLTVDGGWSVNGFI
jgi:NAD(P)-dependent dehydrogenase (short-subunit alcohol dehydrogenase family)